MIIWFHNRAPNLNYKIKEEVIEYLLLQDTVVEPPLSQSEYSNQTTSVRAAAIPTPILTSPQPTNLCTYPMRVEEFFPYWLRNSTESGVTKSNLINLTKYYYDWISCGMTGNSVSFLNLENIIDIVKTPDELVKHHTFSYINSLPQTSIQTEDNPSGIVSPDAAKNLYDNVKVNLYTKKGSEESFRFVLQSLFGITSGLSISYPKRFLLRLNSGQYSEYSGGLTFDYVASSNPQLTGGRLNYSVFNDNDLWQDFSYVLNISGLSAGVYSDVVRPLVHPAGTKDFYDVRKDIFNNVRDNLLKFSSTNELPMIRNYCYYTLLSYESIEGCCGCADVDCDVRHVFPNWDVQISAYPSGTTFGSINIGDFLTLSSSDGSVSPNEALDCTGC